MDRLRGGEWWVAGQSASRHRRAHAELGDHRRHLPRSDRRAPHGPQPARIGASALSLRKAAGAGLGASVRDVGACDAREHRDGLPQNLDCPRVRKGR